jgi:hypothetical protein
LFQSHASYLHTTKTSCSLGTSPYRSFLSIDF